jgi:hypothetical protein
MKHIDKHCIDCSTLLVLEENWTQARLEQGKYVCKPCWHVRDSQRMYVNGKHISVKHPLHKPGNFKTFSDAAFESLAGYATTPEGEVYIIVNPAWKGWIKIGMAIEAEDRLRGYQTSSPLRDFKLKFKKYFDNRRIAEQHAHTLCAKKAIKRKGEWFQIDLKIAKDIITNMEIV